MNLESETTETAHFNWTPLQVEVCMGIAMAKRDAFIAEAHRVSDLVRLKLLDRATAADTLHEAAVYNQLYYEYGQDHIQAIMANALDAKETPTEVAA